MKVTDLICEQIRSNTADIISFRIKNVNESLERAKQFYLTKYNREKKGKMRDIKLSLEIAYQDRTIGQNKLLRALERVMAFEQDGSEDTYQEYHEGLIELYCPSNGRENPITGLSQKKRTSELNTVEMSRVINGAFTQLALMGIDFESSEAIRHYWVEWNNFRSKQSKDPFSECYKEIDEYRKNVVICEACTTGLYLEDGYRGHMAHIVSRGSGGSDDLWNQLHLCPKHHLYLQHEKGWGVMVQEFPHLAWKVAFARVESGAGQLNSDFPGSKLVNKEMARIEKQREQEFKEKAETVREVFDGEIVSEETKEKVC